MNCKAFSLNRKAMFGVAVLAAAGALPVHAATILVDPTAADAAAASDGKCSLREAVLSVNAGANVGDCVADVIEAYGTNDTITLPAGTYNLTVTGFDESVTGTAPNFGVDNAPNAAVGDLDIMKSVRIVGAGADATIIQWDAAVVVDETLRDRIFHVYTTDPLTLEVNVAIEGVTMQGGRTFEDELALQVLDPVDQVLYDYYFRRAGGGLAVGAAANIAKVNPLLVGKDNSTGRGGSKRPAEPDEGGATFSLTLTGVKVQGNRTEGDGAGIYTASPMTATDVLVYANFSTVNGGGIYNEGDTTITNSTISDNTAEGGGGIFMTGSNTVNIRGTTLSGNRAVGGGGISGRSGMTLNLVNSTISGNIGSDVGAGLYTNGSANLNFVTIANNMAGSDSATQGSGINVFPASTGVNVVTLKNVLLAGNMAGSDPALLTSANCGVTGGGIPVTTLGGNLSSDTRCDAWLDTTFLGGDQSNIDPRIGALADNGGPTLTHALAADSPALGRARTDPEVPVDQRGEARQTPPDVGAFELFTADPTPLGGGGGGCAVGGNGRLDPTLPAMLAAALAFFGWRRRKIE